jgi:nitrite reductase (NADH) small subunit
MSAAETVATAGREAGERLILLGPVDQFPPGSRLQVDVGRLSIAVFNVEGRYYAIYGRCPHQSAPLSRGKLQGTVVCDETTGWETVWMHEGEVVVCPGHAMEFHLKTGQAFGYGFKLRTFDVWVENGSLFLKI